MRLFSVSRWNIYRRHLRSLLLRGAVTLAMAVTVGSLLWLLGFVLAKGIPHLSPDLFAWEYTSDNASLMPALVNTLLMTVLALAMAVPLGLFAAIYLVEYAGRGNRLVKLVRVTAETLSGIPSIVYGLFGMLFFVKALGWKISFLSGSATLALMILPLIMRTAEESLRSVPDAYREGGFGLGAGRLRTVFRLVLPAAMPGILAGVVLAVGRIVGETAALLYTAGTVANYPRATAETGHALTEAASSLFSSGRTLSVHMYLLSGEGLHIEQAYATAVVLVVLVAVINALSHQVAKKIVGK